jgi:hypothetical protein
VLDLTKIKAYCLCLDKRYEQGLEVKDEFKRRLNIDVELFIGGDGTRTDIKYDHIDTTDPPIPTEDSINYATWYRRPNALNAHLCHKKIIQRCIDDNNDYMFFFEDDSLITEDFEQIWEPLSIHLETANWDILHFSGYTENCPKIQVCDNLYRVTHAVGNYNLIAKNYMLPILYNLPVLGPMDWLVSTRIQPYFNCMMILPNIIMQRDGYSFVEGCWLKKPDRMKL